MELGFNGIGAGTHLRDEGRMLTMICVGHLQVPGCVRLTFEQRATEHRDITRTTELTYRFSTQVNIPAESGEMGILASHVPAIEQLKPGLVEIIEEAGGSKQFFRMLYRPKA